MKLSGETRGYTIVEVMIFLVVSGGLLVSVLGMISGQQQKTRFQTGVRDFESQLQDTLNDVETGYSPDTTGQIGEGRVGSSGTNRDGNTIFIGKGIQFYTSSTTGQNTSWREKTIQGNTKTSSVPPKDSTTLAEAVPVASGASTSRELLNGIELTNIKYYNGGGFDDSFGVAIVSGISSDGKKSNGSRGQLAKLSIDNPADNEANLTLAISQLGNALNDPISDASKGIVFCLREGGGGRPAAVALGLAYDSTSGSVVTTGQKNISATYFDDEALKFGCTG